MAKPNYSFEKRQRELAKKKKKEEKVKEKSERKQGSDGGVEPTGSDPDDAAPSVGADPSSNAA